MDRDRTPSMPARPDSLSKLIASRPRRERKAAAAATIASVIFHTTVIAGLIWATLAVGSDSAEHEEERITLLEIVDEPPQLPDRPLPPPAKEEPPPPEPTPPPEAEPPPPEETAPPPVVGDVAKGFQTLAEPDSVPDEIPPSTGVETDEADFSGEGVEGGKASGTAGGEAGGDGAGGGGAPTLPSFTVAPELKNRAEYSKAVRKHYPRMLEKAGIGGRVLLWMLIDEEGQVLEIKVLRSSGHSAFDSAAVSVAGIMRFAPALDGEQPVMCEVVIPIDFMPR